MLIKDKSLGRYLINASSDSFDVGTMKTDKEGVERFVPDTFHNNMENAIKKVVKNLMDEETETISLGQWLEKFKQVNDEINNSLKILS